MGCAPSKQNAEEDVDPEKRPIPNDDSPSKSPLKGKKSPKKKGKGQNDAKLANNNAKDAEEVIAAETIQPVQSVNTSAAPNGIGAKETDIDAVTKQDKQAPVSPITAKYGDIWDMTRGMPPTTSPYDDSNSPPPKPDRVNWEEEMNKPHRKGDNYHTFPRRQKQRPESARDGKSKEEGARSNTLERKLSLRERTPTRRKDLDVSGNISLGKMLVLPGPGKVIPPDEVEFLNPDTEIVHVEETREATLPRGSVKVIANAFQELGKMKADELKPKSPIKHTKKSTTSDDGGDEEKVLSDGDDPDHSIIETVNQQILPEYKFVEKKTFEEIVQERLIQAAEEERIRKEEEARRLAEEAEQERLRLEREAEEERIRLEEEARRLAEEAEQERVRLEMEAEEERLRLERQAEEERLRLELEAEEERIRLEREAEAEKERIQAELEAQENLKNAADGQEQGDDPAAHGAEQEDRFYNNKAFEKPDIDSSDPQQQEAALAIQTKYRQYHAKQVVGQKREEVAVVKIQAGYRGWQDRKRVNNMKAEAEAQSQQGGAEEDQEPGMEADYQDDPEAAEAATKIQAGFKGYKARQEVNNMKLEREQQAQNQSEETIENPQQEINLEDPEVIGAATKIQAGFRGYQTRQQLVAVKEQQQAETQEEEPAQEPEQGEPANDDAEANMAASKIQAGFKGMKTRKELKAQREAGQEEEQPGQEEEQPQEEPAPEQQEEGDKQEVDIDLNDPEVSAAATKIQASFKGYMTRKELAADGKEPAADGQQEDTGDGYGEQTQGEEAGESQETKEE